MILRFFGAVADRARSVGVARCKSSRRLGGARTSARFVKDVPATSAASPLYGSVTPLRSVTMAGMRTNYDERFERVTKHLYDHLDEDIDLARLAEVAVLSPYHRHLVFQAQRGESVVATVRRLRLHRAAPDLAKSARPIGEARGARGLWRRRRLHARLPCRLRSAAGRVSPRRQPCRVRAAGEGSRGASRRGEDAADTRRSRSRIWARR